MGLRIYKYFTGKQILPVLMEAVEYRISKVIPEDVRTKKVFLKRIFSSGLKLLKQDDGLTINYDVNGKEYTFLLRKNSSDISVFTQIILEQEYKPIVDLFRKLNYKITRFIDIGANVGFSSLYLAAFYPDAEFVCVEPNEKNYQALLRNLRNNIESDKYVHLQNALWNKATLLSADNSFRDGKEWSFSVKETKELLGEIEGITMDTLLAKCNFDEVDFVKIDIEGAEAQLFNDSRALETWIDKIKVLSIEIHDETNARFTIENNLQDLGFRLFNSGEITIAVNHKLLPLLKN